MEFSLKFRLEGNELVADLTHPGNPSGLRIELGDLDKQGREQAAQAIGTYVFSFFSLSNPPVMGKFPNLYTRYPKY